MEQIERIQHMEEILDEATMTIRDLLTALENYDKIKDKIKELQVYYDSPLWRKDYQDDEEGKLPENLKRGVLSQDAVYNLLADYSFLQKQLQIHDIKIN